MCPIELDTANFINYLQWIASYKRLPFRWTVRASERARTKREQKPSQSWNRKLRSNWVTGKAAKWQTAHRLLIESVGIFMILNHRQWVDSIKNDTHIEYHRCYFYQAVWLFVTEQKKIATDKEIKRKTKYNKNVMNSFVGSIIFTVVYLFGVLLLLL